jgi:thiamine biosynthesis lipoprotein
MAIKGMPVTARTMRIEQIMGTVISIDVRDADVPDDAIEAMFAWLHRVDDRFSTFKAESEVSRLGRGEVTLEECHPDVAQVLAICEELRMRSGGAFNAWRARRDGRLDPSGVVKGWAVDAAAAILQRAGARNFCINAGGDVLAMGVPQPGRKWRVGIRHPNDPDSVAALIEVTDLAIATSGRYERGDHVLDARTGKAARGVLSLTVVGPRMTEADAYATAGFAMGGAGIAWVARVNNYASCGVTSDGRLRFSETFASLIAK